ncbi:MAG: HlyC/CorC family transporter [Phycisphaerae bacterium]|nr:hemolysin family protein [Phycisphaerae bacterium]NUQ47164.1 HlyC/CorC family transporter [Phycisphaerae bacterium]
MPEPFIWVQLAFVPVLIAVNAFFVAAEYAVVTIRSTRLEELKQEGVAAARVLARLKDDMSGSLATIQVCITATNLLLGAVAEPAMTELIAWLLSPLGVVLPSSVARPLSLAVGLMIVTLFTVVLSELLPKALTLQYTERVAVWVARPVALFRVLCNPLVRLMNWMGNRVTHALGLGKVEIEEQVHSEEELEMLVDRADDAGEFHEEHGDLLRRAFDFADLIVRHVMIPIRKVGFLDSNITVAEAVRRLSDWPYTRWPLIDPKSGRVNGIVNIKLVLHALALGADDVAILHDLAVAPMFVDPDMPLVDALTEMRRTRRHMAVVREGDGPDLGIITLEDILQAIVGKIPSEERAPHFVKP